MCNTSVRQAGQFQDIERSPFLARQHSHAFLTDPRLCSVHSSLMPNVSAIPVGELEHKQFQLLVQTSEKYRHQLDMANSCVGGRARGLRM
jgi:hypothetical protein